MPFKHIVHYKTRDSLGFACTGRALNYKFVSPLYPEYRVFLRGVKRIYVVNLSLGKPSRRRIRFSYVFVLIIINILRIFEKFAQ